MCELISIIYARQPSDDGRAEEEEQTKIVPKWKASHMTEILLEPEPDEDEGETTGQGEGLEVEGQQVQEGETTAPGDQQQEDGTN